MARPQSTPSDRVARLQMDHSKVKLENRDLDEQLRRKMSMIERERVHSRYAMDTQMLGLTYTSKAVGALMNFHKEEERIERQKSLEKMMMLARLGKKLRDRSKFGERRPPDSDSDDDDDNDLLKTAHRKTRSASFSNSRTRGRSRPLSAVERAAYIEKLAQPRLTSHLLDAQMLVTKLRSRPKTSIARSIAREDEELAEATRLTRVHEEIRNHILKNQLNRTHRESAIVHSRVRDFCSEVQRFVRSNDQTNENFTPQPSYGTTDRLASRGSIVHRKSYAY